jgi:hypothetical protein
MTAEEFQNIWASSYGIYDNYFVYENYEVDKYVNYKVPYSKTETEIIIDLSQKVAVKREDIWVEMPEMMRVQNSLNEVNLKVEELTTSLNTKEQEIITKDELITSLNTKVSELETEKTDIATKFNEQTEVMVTLNAKIKEFEPIVETYNQEQYDKALNSAIVFYKEKFENVDAIEEFEKEETQELIKKSINSNKKESSDAKFALNELIVLNVKSSNSKKEDDETNTEIKVSLNSTIKAKENKDLTEAEDLFERTYGFKK